MTKYPPNLRTIKNDYESTYDSYMNDSQHDSHNMTQYMTHNMTQYMTHNMTQYMTHNMQIHDS